MEKIYNLFDRKHIYSSYYDLKNVIKTINVIIKKMPDDHVLYSFLEVGVISFHDHYDKYFIADDAMKWLAWKWHNSESEYICDSLLEISKENKEWTKWKNEGLPYTYYRKITFLEDAQNAVIDYLQNALTDLNLILSEWDIDEEKKQKQNEMELRREKFSVQTVYKYIKRSGGKDGQEGYHDADYQCNKTKNIVRMVSKNSIEIGTTCCPKRFEGKELEEIIFTDLERELARWIIEFGVFSGIRM